MQHSLYSYLSFSQSMNSFMCVNKAFFLATEGIIRGENLRLVFFFFNSPSEVFTKRYKIISLSYMSGI